MLTLGNVSQGFSTATIDTIAIDEDPEKVQAVLRKTVGSMAERPEWSTKLLENPNVLGVGSMSGGRADHADQPQDRAGSAVGADPRSASAPSGRSRKRSIRGPILPGGAPTL